MRLVSLLTVALSILALILALCISASFQHAQGGPVSHHRETPLEIRGTNLVYTAAGRTRVILRGVDPSTSHDIPEAYHQVPLQVLNSSKSIAAIDITLNHEDAVVLVDYRRPQTLRFSDAITVPWSTTVHWAPNAKAFLLESDEDLYLPATSKFDGNRGLLYVPIESLAWRLSMKSALAYGHEDDRWDARDTFRYTPSQAFSVQSIRWAQSLCLARIEDGPTPRMRTVCFP